jgi:GNAT superfamily N-acetyltransferase
VTTEPGASTVRDNLDQRVAALEVEVAALRKQLTRLVRPPLRFEDAAVDSGPGGALAQAMREEIAQMYDGLDLDGAAMPKAGPAELSPPDGVFIVGRIDGRAVCCGGVKRLDERTCEIKRMYVTPAARGQGVARSLLHELEDRARDAGYRVARLDTGPRQGNARGLYEAEGYAAIANFNANPVANFWGEKALV